MNAPPIPESQIYAISRPDPSLLYYYGLKSLSALILAPIVVVPLFCKYHTLRYRFDSEGISMSWGLLFRREVNLTYTRIQDIHLSRGIIERWLGLATLSIQTASGSAGAEMTLQGIKEFSELRDFLYSRMRGRQPQQSPAAPAQQSVAGEPTALPLAPSAASSEATETLWRIHQDLVALRQEIRKSQGPPPEERF